MKHLLLALVGLSLTVQLQAKELKLKQADVDLKTSSASSLMNVGGTVGALSSKYFVIQFQNVITEQDKKDLLASGFEILQYLPDDAYIVSGSMAKAVQLKNKNSRIYEVAPYMSEWKLSSELQTMSVFDDAEKVILNIRLLPKADLNAAVAAVKKVNDVKVLASANRYIAVEASKLKALELSNIEGIEFLEVQPEIKTFDMDVSDDDGRDTPPPPENLGAPKTGYETGTKVMNLDKAWERGYTGQGQTVAMSDTGLDVGDVSKLHPDLQTVIGGESVAMFGGTGWNDPQGHGTHVTGSVVSRGVLSDGLIKGGAFNANYYAQGMWSSVFENIMVPQDLEGMFTSAYNHGARIHTNSWGAQQNLGAYDNFAASVDQTMWDHPDMLILFAAGNSGQDLNQDGVIDLGSVSSPGTAKNAMTVGASENYMLVAGRQKSCGEMHDGDKKWGAEPLKSDKLSDNVDGIACFSSRGPTSDQRIKPDIVAPGTNIVSLQSRDPSATKLWGIYNENYSWAGGTSMATPLTAGAAAVAREYLTKNGRANPSAALVKATLMHTAFDIYPGQFGKGTTQEISQKGPNNQQGYGRVDMDRATQLNQSKVIDNNTGVGTGETASVNFNITEKRVQNGGTLKATLVYTDAPAAASAGKTLVNDLDLKVTAPDGKTFTMNDHTNNAEGIEITDLVTGQYKVDVVGNNVPQGKSGKQPYALLVSFVKSKTTK